MHEEYRGLVLSDEPIQKKVIAIMMAGQRLNSQSVLEIFRAHAPDTKKGSVSASIATMKASKYFEGFRLSSHEPPSKLTDYIWEGDPALTPETFFIDLKKAVASNQRKRLATKEQAPTALPVNVQHYRDVMADSIGTRDRLVKLLMTGEPLTSARAAQIISEVFDGKVTSSNISGLVSVFIRMELAKQHLTITHGPPPYAARIYQWTAGPDVTFEQIITAYRTVNSGLARERWARSKALREAENAAPAEEAVDETVDAAASEPEAEKAAVVTQSVASGIELALGAAGSLPIIELLKAFQIDLTIKINTRK